jgi:hypothetical protein
MKQAKVLSYQKSDKSFSWGWGIRALFRVGLRILIACLPLLPFIALATPFLMPETPHLRVKYTYNGSSAPHLPGVRVSWGARVGAPVGTGLSFDDVPWRDARVVQATQAQTARS